AVKVIRAPMFDGEADVGVDNLGARPLFRGRHDHQPTVDLLPPVHPRRVLLADEAALGEADAAQFSGIAFEPEDIGELGAAFADAEVEAMFEPAGRRLVRRSKPT